MQEEVENDPNSIKNKKRYTKPDLHQDFARAESKPRTKYCDEPGCHQNLNHGLNIELNPELNQDYD